MKFYAGIGSRRTPSQVLELMAKAASKLAHQGWVLRSGAAAGADSAFERGCDLAAGQKEIYLPWPGFSSHSSRLCRPSQAALALAGQHHPAWDRCSPAARKLHARNCHQILGPSLSAPVRFVLCWHDGSGGTMQAVRIAEAHGIPVFNLREPEVMERVRRFV